MKRPELKVIEYYDYSDVIRYIEKKYGINTSDFAGKFKKNPDADALYLNFWHWISENLSVELYQFFDLDFEEWMEDAPGWCREILAMIQDEYDGVESMHFYVNN